MEKSAEAEGSRGSKRGVSAPSPQILKRRKVKDGEVVDTKEGYYIKLYEIIQNPLNN
jgi:hypothetical protein